MNLDSDPEANHEVEGFHNNSQNFENMNFESTSKLDGFGSELLLDSKRMPLKGLSESLTAGVAIDIKQNSPKYI